MVLMPFSLATHSDFHILYPVRGIQYFVTHPILWGNLILLTIPQFIITTSVFVVAYAFLYPPQAALAFILNGPVGTIAAFISMFQQATSIARSISEVFLYPKPLRVLFDGVLVQEGMDRVILQGRMAAPPASEESDYRRAVTWMKSVPRKLLFPTWLFMVFLRFCLSFIPFLGPLMIIAIDGPGTAGRCLGRYFELKNYDQPMIDSFIRRHRLQWYSFGLFASFLESLPFIGFVFTFTNTSGGALWAVRIERHEMRESRRGKNALGQRRKAKYSALQ